jgi:hypothetical protein
VVKSVRVDDISELSLVPSISVYSMIWLFCVCRCYVYSGNTQSNITNIIFT